MQQAQGMKVAMVGYGVEGRSAVGYWLARGAEVTVCDQNDQQELPAGVHAQLGKNYLHNLARFDVVMRSAGIHPDILLKANPDIKDKITTTVDEFIRVCPSRNIIGITGTKGKGTTSTLTAKMLEAAGFTVHLGGNIGISPFDFLERVEPEHWVVLELSSFQLYDIKHSPHIAVCLMVVPEHLNWHADMPDYTSAKANLFSHQGPKDIAIYFADNELSHQIASASPGAKIGYYAQPGAYVEDNAIVIDNQRICELDEIRLFGAHNWQNACAAITAIWQATQDITAMRSVLTTFTGLEHRLEFVREIDGVRYYNDSFGTTPETAIVALQAFSEPKVIILGGSNKNSAYDELVTTIMESNMRTVVLIGEMGKVIGEELKAAGFTNVLDGGTTMEEIVATARGAAKSGDVVLLSTACASFDMFRDYKDRGVQFKTAVGAL